MADDITGTGDWFEERLLAIAGPPCVPGGVADHDVRITPSQISGRRVPQKPRSRRARRMVLPAWVPATPVTGIRAGAGAPVGRRVGLPRVVVVDRSEQALPPAGTAGGDVRLDR